MEPPLKQLMNLKVLYTLDDTTTYLGRSLKPLLVRVIDIPNSHIRLGAVDLKKCLQIVLQSSPELVSDNYDFSCYSKDISEPDEPYVGHGMFSNLKDKKGENLVPGRVCTSFASLLGGTNSSETLEVKLRLLKIHNKKRSYEENTSSENEEDNFTAPTTGRYYKRVAQEPLKASRTKSLPAASNKQQQRRKILPNLSQRMNSIAIMPTTTPFQEPKKKTTCLECGTNDSKTWKIIKKPLKQLNYKTGVLCNDCNATMLRSGISSFVKPNEYRRRKPLQNSSSPSIPNLNNVDINDIFSSEYARFGGPLTDIDPLPQQLTPVDDPTRATRLNTTLIDMDEDKENIQPVSPDKPISLLHNTKQTEFEKILAESFHEFSVNSPINDSPSGNITTKPNEWLLFSHAEEDEHHVKQDDYNKKYLDKTPKDEDRANIASSPPMYNTPYKDDSIDKLHTSILTSINDDINSLANWTKVSPPTSFVEEEDDDDTEDEKVNV